MTSNSDLKMRMFRVEEDVTALVARDSETREWVRNRLDGQSEWQIDMQRQLTEMANDLKYIRSKL